MAKQGVWRGARNVFETCRALKGTMVLVSRWHSKLRCFDLPHTGYLIALGAAPRSFHGLNLSSSCFFSCLARKKQYFISVYYTVAEVIFFSVFWLIGLFIFECFKPFVCLTMWRPCICMRWLWCVIAPARGDGEGSRLSGPGVWVSGWHDLLPASWQLLGLLPLSQGDTHEHKHHLCLKSPAPHKPQFSHTKKWSAASCMSSWRAAHVGL